MWIWILYYFRKNTLQHAPYTQLIVMRTWVKKKLNMNIFRHSISFECIKIDSLVKNIGQIATKCTTEKESTTKQTKLRVNNIGSFYLANCSSLSFFLIRSTEKKHSDRTRPKMLKVKKFNVIFDRVWIHSQLTSYLWWTMDICIRHYKLWAILIFFSLLFFHTDIHVRHMQIITFDIELWPYVDRTDVQSKKKCFIRLTSFRYFIYF